MLNALTGVELTLRRSFSSGLHDDGDGTETASGSGTASRDPTVRSTAAAQRSLAAAAAAAAARTAVARRRSAALLALQGSASSGDVAGGGAAFATPTPPLPARAQAGPSLDFLEAARARLGIPDSDGAAAWDPVGGTVRAGDAVLALLAAARGAGAAGGSSGADAATNLQPAASSAFAAAHVAASPWATGLATALATALPPEGLDGALRWPSAGLPSADGTAHGSLPRPLADVPGLPAGLALPPRDVVMMMMCYKPRLVGRDVLQLSLGAQGSAGSLESEAQPPPQVPLFAVGSPRPALPLPPPEALLSHRAWLHAGGSPAAASAAALAAAAAASPPGSAEQEGRAGFAPGQPAAAAGSSGPQHRLAGAGARPGWPGWPGSLALWDLEEARAAAAQAVHQKLLLPGATYYRSYCCQELLLPGATTAAAVHQELQALPLPQLASQPCDAESAAAPPATRSSASGAAAEPAQAPPRLGLGSSTGGPTSRLAHAGGALSPPRGRMAASQVPRPSAQRAAELPAETSGGAQSGRAASPERPRRRLRPLGDDHSSRGPHGAGHEGGHVPLIAGQQRRATPFGAAALALAAAPTAGGMLRPSGAAAIADTPGAGSGVGDAALCAAHRVSGGRGASPHRWQSPFAALARAPLAGEEGEAGAPS